MSCRYDSSSLCREPVLLAVIVIIVDLIAVDVCAQTDREKYNTTLAKLEDNPVKEPYLIRVLHADVVVKSNVMDRLWPETPTSSDGFIEANEYLLETSVTKRFEYHPESSKWKVARLEKCKTKDPHLIKLLRLDAHWRLRRLERLL